MARETTTSTESLNRMRRRLLAPVWTGGTALASSVRARVRRLRLTRFERRKRRVLYFVGGLLCVLGLGYAMLLWTPLPLSVVTPRITAALEERLGPGYSADIGGARLDRNENGSAVRLSDFEILDPDGRTILAVPNLLVNLDRADDSLFGLGFGPARRIQVESPRVSLRIDEGGGLMLTGGEALALRVPGVSVQDAAARPVAELVAALDALLGQDGPLAALESIVIRDAGIVLDDRRNGWSEELTDVQGRFTRRPDGGLGASLVSSEPTQPWSVSATMNGVAGAERSLDLGFENINIGRVLRSLRPAAPDQTLEGRLSGHVYAGIASSGKVSAYDVRVDMGGIALGGADNGLRIDGAHLEARWDFDEPRLSVRDLKLQTGWGRGRLVMDARPVDKAAPGGEWSYAIAGQDVVLANAAGNTPVLFSSVSAKGQVALADNRMRLDRLILASPAINIAGQASLDWSGERPVLDAAFSGSRVPVGAILSLWPPVLAPRTRTFISTNIRAGIADDIVFAAQGPLIIPPPPPGVPKPKMDVALDVLFSGAEFASAATPVILTQGRGTVNVANHALIVAVESGQLTSPGRGSIEVTPSTATVADMVPDDPEIDLRLGVKGPAATSGRVLSALDSAADVELFDRITEGEVTGTLNLRARTLPGAKLEMLDRSARFETRNLAIPSLVGPLDLTKGRLAVTLGTEATEISGDAVLGGAPVSIGGRARRVDDKLAETTVNITGDPSRVQGMGKMMGGVSGSAALRLQMPSPGVIDGATVEADLSGTRIDIGAAGTTKAIGQPGTLGFTVRRTEQGTRLEQFRLAAAPIAANGYVDLDRDGALTLARFDTLRLAGGDDARLDVTRSGNGFKFLVRGAALDARPFLRSLRGGSGKSAGDLDIDVKLDRALAFGDETLSDVIATARRRGSTLQALAIDATLGRGRVEARLSGGAKGHIYVQSGDAGALLRGLDIYRKIRGGGFELTAPADGKGQGFMAMRDFAVVGEKALASVTANRREGPSGQEVVNFSKARVVFRQEEGRMMIDESAIWGPDIGATLDGILDFGVDRMSLTGTFVPAYALNNFFAKIPIIGALLGGGQYEGLLGVTFKVEGQIGNPTMSVNPVSAVAPGFLRKLFEFRNQDPGIAPDGQAVQRAPG